MTNSKKSKTMKILFPAVLLLPVLAALIPCTANAQVDPGARKPEATPAAAPANAGDRNRGSEFPAAGNGNARG